MEQIDVLIVGAGLSGIGAAARMRRDLPGRSVAILEARDAIGGTWDLFRYPGIRSDSDMHTLGYPFRPWRRPEAIGQGSDILAYLRETAEAEGVLPLVRLRHKVESASWDSAAGRWTVIARTGGQEVRIAARFLLMASGYYDPDAGYTPDFPGIDRFGGQLVHPQHWPERIDFAGRRIVVIGSGATAVTLIPALARTAAHVTMLQRSPSYIMALPAEDRATALLRRWLPSRIAEPLARWQHILIAGAFYRLSRAAPHFVGRRLIAAAHKAVGGDPRHLTPRYRPWDERLCFAPDGDLFQAIRSGRATIVTDEIDQFTPDGIALRSGDTLDADIVVTATGLTLRLLGGVALSVDGKRITPADELLYRGVMLSGVPNLAVLFGYTNASWTLRSDLSARWVIRLIRRLDRTGATAATPRRRGDEGEAPLMRFTSGYIQRGLGPFPKQGRRDPWRLRQSYVADLAALRWAPMRDGVLELR